MKDRIVQNPHRYQLVPVAGQEGIYDIIAKPGTITEVGTPINKATLLKDETAALYGLTGDDATVDGALKNVENVAQTINKLYGSVAFSDSIPAGGTLTKTIAIGAGKKFGILTIEPTAYASYIHGISAHICTDALKTMVYGNVGYTDARRWGAAWTRRHLGCITQGSTEAPSGARGVGSIGGGYDIKLLECYINGTNIQFDFRNNATVTQSLGCTIDWEVW